MAVKVTFSPSGKRLLGKVEIDGVDISNRVTDVGFAADSSGFASLRLDLVLRGDGDEIVLDVPDEMVEITTRRLEPKER